MNTLLTIAAFALLAAACAVGLVAFIKEGGVKELIRIAREND